MSELVQVTVEQGTLRGIKTANVIGGSYISFKGVPYAAPPVGDLRFKDPQPPTPWLGVREATKEGQQCAQFNPFVEDVIGGDDCLYLNISTTSLTGSRPVMIWIHGGGFSVGDGGYEVGIPSGSPDYFMKADVVYVSINYRLGVLGFLNLDHKVAPGNMGLKDQVAALVWVKKNIAQFGGDPNNVTIFGQSAGGASVHYLLLSPLAKGLFHKAILQSGVVLNPFASSSGPTNNAHRYVAALGKDITNPDEIVKYLRTLPVQKLIEVQQSLHRPEDKTDRVLHWMNLANPFGPSVDDKSEEPFMPRNFREMAAEGFEVPAMIGYCSHEGLTFVDSMLFPAELYAKMYEILDENLDVIVPRHLAEKAPSKVSEIAREMKNFYFGDKRITEDLVDEYAQCYGDVHFGFGIHEIVEIQRGKKSPTYFYRFSFDSPNSIAKSLMQIRRKGAVHAEELPYLFYSPQTPDEIKIKPGTTGDIVRNRMVTMWSNFAKTGNPTPSTDDLITVKWEPVTATSKKYLEIDTELSAGVNPNEEMWEMEKRIQAMADDQ